MKEIIDNLNNKKQTAYQATSTSLETIKEVFPEYTDILNTFNEGVKKVELRKRFMLKKIDEVWVRAIEDTLPSIDVIIRHPGVLLQEKEEVLPVELTRKITGRSVEYLSQHTDMINEIRDDGTVVPSKILNVFQDDTVLTYENKFINTLLNRLYAFVSMRYDAARECGEDEKNTVLTFNQEFEKGEKKGKISLSIEISEPPKDNENIKNYIYASDLWKRVTNVKKIVNSYMSSPFVMQLGRNFVRPPIMRTNKLLKNVEFRQCLTLWEFLESYENTSYETLIAEDLENISEDCIRDYYNTLVAQYILFQKHIKNEFEEEHVLDKREAQEIHPLIKEELDAFNEREYDYRDVKPNKQPESILETGEENDIEQAIKIALSADEQLFALEQENKFAYKYRYSFLSRLILAQNPAQNFYTAIKNELLSYKKVKSKISWNHETFSFGRSKCARINVKGKTLYLYLPLDLSEFIDSKYHLKDVSNVKKNKDLPALLKVKSDRGVKYAKELIAIIMQSLGIEKIQDFISIDYHMPLQTIEELLKVKLVKLINGTFIDYDKPKEEPKEEIEETPEEVVKNGILYRYRYSFTSRLILAQNPIQDYYEEIKNELLSYKKV
ncbi:MAG: DUF2357 domain-containing protein, partial [Firmicutes bacterium]|nr:DUF2357 domain-containing protein [Candidatus Caballimonas caccae]